MLRRLMLSAYAGLRHDTELAAQMKADGYSAETCALAEPYLSRVRLSYLARGQVDRQPRVRFGHTNSRAVSNPEPAWQGR